MRSFILFCLCLGALANIELSELSQAIYPAQRARVAVPWTHEQLSEASAPLRLAFVLPKLEEHSATSQVLAKMVTRGHQIQVYTFEESSVTSFPVETLRNLDRVGSKGLVYAQSQAAFQALTGAPHFDAVVFDGPLGLVSLQAKQAGLAFSHTVLAVRVRAPEARELTRIGDVVRSFMERQSVKLADVLLTSEAGALRSLAAAGFEVPAGKPVYEVAARAWVSFLEFLPSELPAVQEQQQQEQPLVSVVVTTYNRPEYLLECVAALEAQTYEHLELVVVDDGSTEPRVARVLQQLESHPNVRVVRQRNQYLGAARNAGVQAASGDLVLFMDDDNLAFPAMVATLVRALQTSGADVAVNAHSVWEETKPKTSAHVWTPLGPAPLAGLLENVLGNANFMIRKSAFQRLGGFSTDRTGLEDYEFHAGAVLGNTPYVVVPRSLMFYRIHDREEQMYFETAGVEANERALRPYASLLQKTGHSTRDVHEFKRVSAQTCEVVRVQRQICTNDPTFRVTVYATPFTQAPYADTSSTQYYASAIFDGANTGTFSTPVASTGLTVSEPTGLADGRDSFVVAFRASPFSALSNNVNPRVRITLNGALGYVGDITCDGQAPVIQVDPTCGGCGTAASLCACQSAGGTCTPLDTNGDGVWDTRDLASIIAQWGPIRGYPNPISDINGDNVVDIAELAQLLFAWARQLQQQA